MTIPKVLIDASNLHAGGAVQVAASFLDELAGLKLDAQVMLLHPWIAAAHIEASDIVIRNLANLYGDTVQILDLHEENRRPISTVSAWMKHHSIKADVSFNIFGPDYLPPRATKRIMGFADVTSLFPERTRHDLSHPINKIIRDWIRTRTARALFRRSDLLITETESTCQALADRWRIPPQHLQVVPNTVAGAFRAGLKEKPTDSPRRVGEKRRVSYVARGYPHKNIDILGAVGSALKATHGIDVEFVLTLTTAEFSELSPETRAASHNVGPQLVGDLPAIYYSCDAAIFPSLSESFSVTPLEALATGTPLVASNLPFVTDLIGPNVAWYADPTSPQALAEELADALKAARNNPRSQAGMELFRRLPTPRSRALRYVETISRVMVEGSSS